MLIALLAIVIGVVFGLLEVAARGDSPSAGSIHVRPRSGDNQNARGYFSDSVVDRWGLLMRRDERPLLRDNAGQGSLPQRRQDPVGQGPIEYRGERPTPRIERIETARVPRPLQMPNENNDTKALIGRWRRSIVGLVRMADRNLQAARQLVAIKNYPAAFQAASASVENVSRALIHCYGDKPDLEPGQEEPLRLLSLRFRDAEKENFEKAIDEVARIRKHIADRQTAEATAQSIVEWTSKVVDLFKQMIKERCMTEIPELRDACPRCVAIDVSTWYFNQNIAIQQCGICHYKWTEPRQ